MARGSVVEERLARPFRSQRFEVVGPIGSGGMGVVYEARDRVNGNVVAIKTLSDVEPDALLRFKTEFRALQDVHHPNLVQLYELIEEDGAWFFTMELVRSGVPFDKYARPGVLAPLSRALEDATPTQPFDETSGVSRRRPVRAVRDTVRGGPTYDEARLRRALAQLAEALSALHDANKIHCDIKPSNVLVTDDRVVVIDFGILLDTAKKATDRSEVYGTPAFMAPEQLLMLNVGPPADWYALGGLLYVALTGRAPFADNADNVIEMKQIREPIPPDALVPALPDDLVSLCIELLARDPKARPRGADVVRRLRGDMSRTLLSARPKEHFLGRDAEIEQLGQAFEASQGAGVTIVLHGEAGIGKSALAAHFASRLEAEGRAWVLTGRCDQRETVPFKAVDEVFDALSDEIGARFSGDAASLLPERADLLAQTFPTLQRLPSFKQAANLTKPVDARRTRELVFASARDFVGRLATAGPLCIVVEDLHWADPDSLSLVVELMRPPAPRHVLLVATMRTTDDTQQRLRELGTALGVNFRSVTIGALPPAEALSLAERLVGADAAQAIVHETGGHPLFIESLAHSKGLSADSAKRGATLDEALWARAQAASPGARAILAALSLASVALPQNILAAATWMTLEASLYCTTELRKLRLVRVDDEGLSPYHDLVRRAVIAHVPPEEYTATHAALAEALEQHDAGQPEALAIHWMEAGQKDRALAPALKAAQQATRALAFDRAARLHGLILELLPAGDPRRRDLYVAHGQALANAGRGAQAARAFLAAADLSKDGVLELRRLAAELFLMSGQVDEGLVTLKSVLANVGIQIPSSPLAAMASLAVQRARIRLGRIDASHLRETLTPDEATRIDACWSAASGLGLVDTIRGAELQARHFRMALQGGDRHRAARALTTEACYAAIRGARATPRVERLLDLASRLAHESNDARAIGFATAARGITAAQMGLWRQAHDQCEKAEALLRERCQGVAWELNTARLFRVFSMVYMGQTARVVELLPTELREAEERGDLNGVMGLKTGQNAMAWLAADDPDEGDRQLDDALARWSHKGYQIPHYQAWASRVHILLYRGRGRDALAFVRKEWGLIRRSLFLNIQILRVLAHNLLGRAALGAARQTSGWERRGLLRVAARAKKRLEGEGAPWASAFAKMLDAQVLVAGGQRERACARFREARDALLAADMHLDAAAARRAHGMLLGGAEGRSEVALAEDWMARERIARGDPMYTMIVPYGTEA